MIKKLEEYKALIRYSSVEDIKQGIGTVDGKEFLLENIVEKINEIVEAINQ